MLERITQLVICASAALVVSGCLTVNNIPVKDDDPSRPDATVDGAGRDGSTDPNPAPGDGSTAPEPDAGEGGTVPEPQRCEDLPDVVHNDIPLQGVKDYCPAGYVCDGSKHCVPMVPCTPGAPTTCSLDALIDLDRIHPNYNPFAFVAVDAEFFYWLEKGTYGQFDAYQKDGAVFRARIGEWKPQLVASSLNNPEAIHVVGDQVYWFEEGSVVYRAPSDGSAPKTRMFTFPLDINKPEAPIFTATHAYGWNQVRNGANYRYFPVRAALEPGAELDMFTSANFGYGAMLAADAEYLYVGASTGHFRIRTVDGGKEKLDAQSADRTFGLIDGQWVSIDDDEHLWISVRGTAEAEAERVGGHGDPILFYDNTFIRIADHTVFYLTTGNQEGIAPAVRGWTMIALNLESKAPQQIINLEVGPGDQAEPLALAVSRAGAVITNVSETGQRHAIFRAFE